MNAVAVQRDARGTRSGLVRVEDERHRRRIGRRKIRNDSLYKPEPAIGPKTEGRGWRRRQYRSGRTALRPTTHQCREDRLAELQERQRWREARLLHYRQASQWR